MKVTFQGFKMQQQIQYGGRNIFEVLLSTSHDEKATGALSFKGIPNSLYGQ